MQLINLLIDGHCRAVQTSDTTMAVEVHNDSLEQLLKLMNGLGLRIIDSRKVTGEPFTCVYVSKNTE